MPSTLPASEAHATLYDGRSAHPWRVALVWSDAALTLTRADGEVETIDIARLARARDGSGQRVVLRRTDAPDWRLLLDPGATLPPLRRAAAPTSRTASIVAASVAATLGIGALLWLQGSTILEAFAPLIPRRVAARVGDTIVAQLGAGEICHTPAGDAALARLAARVRSQHGPQPASVAVARVHLVNAFAAPGGRVILFTGLIDKARTPEEVAGVIAHEAAHVALRHPEQAMLRYLGLSAIAQALGGNIGALADLALLLANTRAKEAAADAGAVAAMRAGDIDPGALADFLGRIDHARAPGDRIDRTIDRLGDYAATHPGDASRIVAIRAAPRAAHPRAALNASDWVALRSICSARR